MGYMRDSKGRRLDSFQVADAAAAASSVRIPDLVNSWWSWPDFVRDPIRDRYYVTGCTRGGAVYCAWFDRRTGRNGRYLLSVERHLADDHYTRAIWLQTVGAAGALGTADNIVPVIAGSYHDRDASLRIHKFGSYSELDIPAVESIVSPTGQTAAAYGTLMAKRPDTNTASMVMLYRADSTYMSLIRSTDGGATWGAPVRLHNKKYGLIRRTGNTLHGLAIDHTTDAVIECRYFKNALTSAGGSFRNAPGAGINNTGVTGGFWDAVPADLATPVITNASMDLVRVASGSTSQRVFDMTGSGNFIALGTYAGKTGSELAVGCTYKVMTRQTSATTNAWAEETLIDSGAAFGPSGYVGGMCFDSTGAVILIRNNGGTWTVERWVRTGTAFGAGTWAMAAVLYTAPAGVVGLGRPRCAVDLSDFSLAPNVVTFGEYLRYDPASFLDFSGDQVLVTY